MHESILIKNIKMILPNGEREGDVLIKDGKISQIAPSIAASAELIISESGLIAMPGLIDTHVHFRDPGLSHKEDFATGSAAAAAGGVTSIIDMPNTIPPTCTAKLLNEKRKIAQEKSLVNYNFWIGANGQNTTEINQCQNIAGIKLFLGSSSGNLLIENQTQLHELFQQANHLITVHAELESVIAQNRLQYNHSTILNHEKIRSVSAATAAIQIAIDLALKYQKRLHILHISSRDEAALIAKYHTTGLITAELTPHHLLLHSPDVYQQHDTLAQVNPPIRTRSDQTALLNALKTGIIDTIASDHAPHTLTEKTTGFGNAPSGMPLIELMLSLMLNQVNQAQWDLSDIVKWMCTNPATLIGIQNKGQLRPDFDADIVLIDLKTKKTIQNESLFTKPKWSIFNQQTLQGWPIITIVNGQIVYREGEIFDQIKGKEIIIKK